MDGSSPALTLKQVARAGAVHASLLIFAGVLAGGVGGFWALGIEGKLLREFGLSALMHDIGKVRTPKDILNKPDKLTDDEFVDTFATRPATLSIGGGELAPAMEARLLGLAEGSEESFALAAGEVSEESLTRWIRDNWPSQ